MPSSSDRTYFCKEELDRERFLVAVDSKIEAMRYLTPVVPPGPGVCSTSVVIHAEPLWLPPNVAPLVRLTSRSRLRRFDPASTLCSGARQSTAKNLHVTPNLEVCRAVDFPHLSLEFTIPKRGYGVAKRLRNDAPYGGPSMTASVHVLVVAPTPAIAETVTSRLVSLRANVTLVTSFNAARQGLCESTPDLLISEVRLGEFNGLHLALRARSKGIRAIVLGDNDQVTQRRSGCPWCGLPARRFRRRAVRHRRPDRDDGTEGTFRPPPHSRRLSRRDVRCPVQRRRHHAEALERDVALVLPEEVQELLVVLRRHVEALHQHLVVAARVLEAEPDDVADIVAGEVARHERLVDLRPERRAVREHPIEQHLRIRRERLAPRRQLATASRGVRSRVTSAGSASTVIRPSRVRSTSRSATFRSSRTLPGQW